MCRCERFLDADLERDPVRLLRNDRSLVGVSSGLLSCLSLSSSITIVALTGVGTSAGVGILSNSKSKFTRSTACSSVLSFDGVFSCFTVGLLGVAFADGVEVFSAGISGVLVSIAGEAFTSGAGTLAGMLPVTLLTPPSSSAANTDEEVADNLMDLRLILNPFAGEELESAGTFTSRADGKAAFMVEVVAGSLLGALCGGSDIVGEVSVGGLSTFFALGGSGNGGMLVFTFHPVKVVA